MARTGGGPHQRSPLRNVKRLDGYGEHGWLVRVTRRGRRRVQYFADSRYGGQDGALRRALQRRDELEGQMPPPVKLKRRYSLNKTGVVGVALEVQRMPTGHLVRYYTASWTELTGERKRARFLTSRYGEAEARRLAIKTRREAVKRILSCRGAQPWWRSRSGR
jgi:hypothetical protein